MKNLLVYILVSFIATIANGQYYLRGEIKNEKGENLQNVNIRLHSDKLLYKSGVGGGFGISSSVKRDSITLTVDGYEAVTAGISADKYFEVTMKQLSANASKNRPKLISITKDNKFSSKYSWFVSDESYFSLVENEDVNAEKFPNTGFSLNINKASYSNIRRFVAQNSVVPPDAVRIEELLNYFNLNYKEPEKGEYFKIESNQSTCPWDAHKRLMYLNINARKLDLEKVPPSNLVFLIDASGSMDMPNRLPLVKAAFQMLVKNLRATDTVSIVIYGGAVAVWMQPTSGAEKQKIIQSIEELTASGDTPGESAIRLAYMIAKRSFIRNGNNRVIIATDGDFNVGETSEEAMEALVTKERQSGVYLTCLGVGMGNFKDSKLETLAKRGNGNYAYLDDIKEAEKVLVKEVTQTFYSVADDVFLNVHFNPALVKDYRLVGFDNKRDAIADSTGSLEGGEIGSGNSVMAIFEYTPTVTNDSIFNLSAQNTPIAEVDLRYTPAYTKTEKHLMYKCDGGVTAFNATNKELQFAATLAMFGMKLRQSKYLPPKTSDWDKLESMALNAHNANDYLQKEFLNLMANTKKLYDKSKKKKKKGKDEEEE
ncbi:MAG TPA: von Willebrand factor type A domain-containing protein [Ferruginibacter sp.]|nr:von Willebrand factor type A domain-containing protein [Ferruginibacter sp.]HPH90471.1 von Willebrand factor type A domain-containing protein [Ferruginibacter sp.]